MVYVHQLTVGCGVAECVFPHCRSNPTFQPASSNEALINRAKSLARDAFSSTPPTYHICPNLTISDDDELQFRALLARLTNPAVLAQSFRSAPLSIPAEPYAAVDHLLREYALKDGYAPARCDPIYTPYEAYPPPSLPTPPTGASAFFMPPPPPPAPTVNPLDPLCIVAGDDASPAVVAMSPLCTAAAAAACPPTLPASAISAAAAGAFYEALTTHLLVKIISAREGATQLAPTHSAAAPPSPTALAASGGDADGDAWHSDSSGVSSDSDDGSSTSAVSGPTHPLAALLGDTSRPTQVSIARRGGAADGVNDVVAMLRGLMEGRVPAPPQRSRARRGHHGDGDAVMRSGGAAAATTVTVPAAPSGGWESFVYGPAPLGEDGGDAMSPDAAVEAAMSEMVVLCARALAADAAPLAAALRTAGDAAGGDTSRGRAARDGDDDAAGTTGGVAAGARPPSRRGHGGGSRSSRRVDSNRAYRQRARLRGAAPPRARTRRTEMRSWLDAFLTEQDSARAAAGLPVPTAPAPSGATPMALDDDGAAGVDAGTSAQLGDGRRPAPPSHAGASAAPSPAPQPRAAAVAAAATATHANDYTGARYAYAHAVAALLLCPVLRLEPSLRGGDDDETRDGRGACPRACRRALRAIGYAVATVHPRAAFRTRLASLVAGFPEDVFGRLVDVCVGYLGAATLISAGHRHVLALLGVLWMANSAHSSAMEGDRAGEGRIAASRFVPAPLMAQDGVDLQLDAKVFVESLEHGHDTEDIEGFSLLTTPFVYDTSAKGDFIRYSRAARMEMRGSMPRLSLQVYRQHIVTSTISAVDEARERRILRLPLRVKFRDQGEVGVDEGGVQKEFFMVLFEHLFDPNYGMFTPHEEASTYWFSFSTVEQAGEFRLLGCVVGLALANGVMVDVRFPPVLYRRLLNLPVRLRDFAELCPSTARGMQMMLDHDPTDKEGFEAAYGDTTFEATYTAFDRPVTIPIVPDGASKSVTLENRHEYVAAYVKWYLVDAIKASFDAFRSGFEDVCGPGVLGISATAHLSPYDLERLLVGKPNFDLGELRDGAQYQGYEESDAYIHAFWDIVLNKLKREEQRQFLMFCTGTDKVPLRGLSSIKFVVVKQGDDSERLPSAHTCFYHLMLPHYSSVEKLEAKLRSAIHECHGFGLL